VKHLLTSVHCYVVLTLCRFEHYVKSTKRHGCTTPPFHPKFTRVGGATTPAPRGAAPNANGCTGAPKPTGFFTDSERSLAGAPSAPSLPVARHGPKELCLWPMLFSRRRTTKEENDMSKLKDQIITLRETVAVLYGLYSELSDNPDLVESVSVIGAEDARINTAAMHLLAGIRKLV
jgi:hypothetical protein